MWKVLQLTIITRKHTAAILQHIIDKYHIDLAKKIQKYKLLITSSQVKEMNETNSKNNIKGKSQSDTDSCLFVIDVQKEEIYPHWQG